MQSAVMLAVYLVSQSKAFDDGVGGAIQVVVVTAGGASINDPDYIIQAEQRVQDFLKITDRLFLDAVDTSIQPSRFSAKMVARTKTVKLRQRYANATVELSLRKALNDPTHFRMATPARECS